jgi:serine/threonine protein kinase
MAYMHEEGIIHRDLKMENILLSVKETKLGDFGLSVYNKNFKKK